jgi:4-hydroxybenzoate polyprenyltransferase
MDISIHLVVLPALFVFSSTWFIYQLSCHLYFLRNVNHDTNNLLYIWLHKNKKFTILSLIISSIVSSILFVFLTPSAKLLMLFLGGLSLFYAMPLPIKNKRNNLNYRLRDIPLVKIFLISLTWAGTTVILPALQVGNFIPYHLFCLQFVFIFFITIPFDINDMEIDRAIGVKTIPNLLGIKKALILEGFMVFTLVFLTLIWRNKPFFDNFNPILFINLILFYTLLLFITILYAKKLSKWAIMLIFDGSMIVYFVLVILFKKGFI